MKINYNKCLTMLACVCVSLLAVSAGTALAQTGTVTDFSNVGVNAIDTVTGTFSSSAKKVYNMVYLFFGLAAVIFTGYNAVLTAFGDDRHKNKMFIGIAIIIIFIIVMTAIKAVFFKNMA